MLQVVASGLHATAKHFATPLPEAVLDRSGTFATLMRRFALSRRVTWLDEVLLSDWRQLRGFALRLRFLREHLFPDPEFIRNRYGVSHTFALPFLYVHRLAAGAFRLL